MKIERLDPVRVIVEDVVPRPVALTFRTWLRYAPPWLPLTWPLATAVGVVLGALLVGCGGVTVAAADAARDSASPDGAVAPETGGIDSSSGGAGTSGADASPVDAGPDYGPAPGPRPGMPDGGWAGGVVGNCYDMPCADGSHRATSGLSCTPASATSPICIVCAGWPGAPGPDCVTNATGRAQPGFYVHDCADPKCR